MRQIAVYVNETKAGVLTESAPGKDYVFCYDEDYLVSSGPSISLTLPKRKEEYKSEHLFPFFTNMVPEGANRKVICRSQRIDEHDFFGMLAAMADGKSTATCPRAPSVRYPQNPK